MHLSAIISTYNQPQWLEKVVWGFAAQTHADFELVIADDGSTAETRNTIDRLRTETGVAIRHVWHEDSGFRKCTILNQAIVAAQADYLVFTDGDCIPRRDFLAQHVRFAQPGYMLSGGAVRLPMDVSRTISKADILAGRAHQTQWLRSQGMPWSSKVLKLSAGPRWAWLCDRFTTTKATWNGGNASTWKENLLRVNGFDERMEYGGEDRELGQRLLNFGVRAKSLRYHAVCVHLDHARGYVRQEALARNEAIRHETRRTHAVWTVNGIVKGAQPNLTRAA
jgi:glycosyltransferase involved in cell wall biosynthesis